MTYQPSPEVQKVLDKWTVEGQGIVSNDVRVLWEEIQRLAYQLEPGKVFDHNTKGSGA